jgi:hypothetical protein
MKARRDCNCPCHSGQWIHVVPCCEDRPLAGLATRLNRLGTSTGLNVVAIGIVASALSLVMFTIQDLLTLLTGKFVAFHGPKGIWYVVLAILAALFCAMNVFVLRPGLPRFLAVLLSITMASHVLEQFVALPAQQLKLAAICRSFVVAVVILLFWRSPNRQR